MMVYTVTFNPALDYVVKVDGFHTGTVNRTAEESLFYGGKGINVSVLLKELGVGSTALGFTAGFTGAELERGVKELGISSDFIRVKNGMTRINIKLKSDKETEINGMGPEIKERDLECFFERIDGLMKGDFLVLSGSIPASVDEKIYEHIMKRLNGKGVRCIVDATGRLLLNVLSYHPFLIKPNQYELEELFSVQITSKEDIVFYAKKLKELGAVNVLVSMAKDGAILITEQGEVHKLQAPSGIVKNSVGAGDSMVAGFLAGYLEKQDYSYALKLGAACGSATAFSEGLAKRREIFEILDKI